MSSWGVVFLASHYVSCLQHPLCVELGFQFRDGTPNKPRTWFWETPARNSFIALAPTSCHLCHAESWSKHLMTTVSEPVLRVNCNMNYLALPEKIWLIFYGLLQLTYSAQLIPQMHAPYKCGAISNVLFKPLESFSFFFLLKLIV